MALPLVSLLLALLLLLAFSRGILVRLGFGRSLRLLLLWGVILAGGALTVRLLGLA